MQSTALSLAAILLLAGCTAKEPPVKEQSTESAAVAEQKAETAVALPVPPAMLNDLQRYPQDARFYAENIEAKSVLLKAQKAFEAHWFAPWSYTKPPQRVEEVAWPFDSYRSDDAYGENLKPLPQEWFDAMHEEANFGAYGSVNRYAVSLHFSNLRNFPTHKPLFKNPSEAGEGFPFDYLQNSGVHANEPLYVSHYSKSGAWVYVFSAYATGWLPSHAIAYIAPEHARQWQGAKQLFITKEQTPIRDAKGNFLFFGRIGMMLPLIAEDEETYHVLAVTTGPKNGPWYEEARIEKSAASDEPLLLNYENLPSLANEMLSSHYGWGGLYEERDCSSTLRDLFAPFGIWLPRNSYQQSRVGRVISFEGLSDAQKLERIKSDGVPFETLLYRKGHIVLYLGTYHGQVVILHNMWGVKTKNGEENGRKIVGRTVISTLDIGAELPTYDTENALLTQLESMNIITAPALQKTAKR